MQYYYQDLHHVPMFKGKLSIFAQEMEQFHLFLSARTKAKITGVELQERLADMAT